MNDDQFADYKKRLLKPEGFEYVQQAMQSLPDKVLKDVYTRYFRKSPTKGATLLSANLAKIADARGEHIRAALPRIQQREPELLEQLADTWLQMFKPTLDRLENGGVPEANVPHNAVAVAHFLVQLEGVDSASIWTTRLSAQMTQISDLEHRLKAETGRVQELERKLEQMQRKLESSDASLEKRIGQQKIQSEKAFQAKLEQLQKAEQQKLLLTRTASDLEIKVLYEMLSSTQRELEFFKDQLDTATDALAIQDTERKALLEPLQLTNKLLSSDLLEKTQALSDSETARAQLRSRCASLEQELEKSRVDNKKLAQNNLQRERDHQRSVGSTKLENALILDYRHLDTQPAGRLLLVFQIYKAFLENRYDFTPLLQHTNYSDFANARTEVRGILLLGSEQMLLDGANLPLESWLNSQMYRQESVLKQLLGALKSPRLTGAA